MNYSNYSFTLNLQIHQSQISIPVSLNDTARKLYITFIDGRKPYTIPNGCRAVFVGFKPDGTTLFNDCIIQENKTVIYEFTEQTANVEGIVDCEIRLYGEDGKQLTSSQFIMIVDENNTRDISLSENESTAIDSIIHAEIGRVEAEAERAAAEKSRKELADFLATSGGVIVSDEEPQEGLANVWVDDSPEKEEIRLLDSTDIAQELSDDDEKIPSVALLKKSLDEIETGASGKDGLTPYIKDGNWWIGETDTGVKAEGKDGINGIDGKDGEKGDQGEQGEKGDKGDKGDKGEDGKDGIDGTNGVDGKDYVLTPADKTEIAEQTVKLVDGVPDYVITEAEDVIYRVIAAQGNRTFTFAAITDMHYGNNSYTDGIKHACKALKYIDERIKLDAVAVLGDYTDGYPASAYANAISDFKDINKILDTLRFGQNLRIQGNHDYYEGHKGEINRFIASYSDGVTWGNITGGYFYKDFDGYKIRVICVNTTEAGGGDIGVSTEQYNWFANSLDLSSKADASEWQILILSHHPLDWWSNSYVFAYILDAYKKGTTWSDGTITVDFTDKNSATLIGNIHGHVHNFLTDYIHLGNVNSGNKSDILRMATPNACYGRENQYTESVVGVNTWVEDTTYEKMKDSATDTAFCIYVVNLEACTITAISYGAGYDRKDIGYLAKAPIVNIIDTVGYTDTKRLGTSDGGFRDNDNTFVTGFIQLKHGDVIRTSGVDFNADNDSNCGVWVYQEDQSYWTYQNTKYSETPLLHSVIRIDVDSNGNLTITPTEYWEDRWIRLCGIGSGANLLVTKNQPIG